MTADEVRAQLAAQQIPTTQVPQDSAMAALQAQIADLAQKLAEANGREAALMNRTGTVLAGKGETKAYYHTIPFSNIQVMRGPGHCEQLTFAGGMLETDDLQAQHYLDQICDKSGSPVTSAPQTAVSQEEENKRTDVRAAAIKARDKMLAAGESVV